MDDRVVFYYIIPETSRDTSVTMIILHYNIMVMVGIGCSNDDDDDDKIMMTVFEVDNVAVLKTVIRFGTL